MNETQLTENAKNLFNSGYNCSQSVLSTFAEYLRINNEIATHIAAGFGAGMGRLQNTCGAVTGAYMVFGRYCGNKYETNKEIVEATYEMIQTFEQRFSEKNKTTNCKKLIDCDLTTEEGKNRFREENLKEKICEACVVDAVEIIQAQIKH